MLFIITMLICLIGIGVVALVWHDFWEKTRKYRVIFFNGPRPPCLVTNDPTGATVPLNPLFERASGWLVWVLNKGGLVI